MDAEQRDELRRWADRLATSPSREAQAAARAIRSLLDEVERLNDELEARLEAEREEARLAEERERRRAERERRRREGGERRAQRLGPRRPSFPRISLPRPPRRATRVALVAAAVAAVLVAGAAIAAEVATPHLDAQGPERHAVLGAAAAKQIEFVVAGDADALADAQWMLNGRDATSRAVRAPGRSILRVSALPEGNHRVQVTVPGRLPGAAARRTWDFVVDLTPPPLSVDARSLVGRPLSPMKLTGRVEDGATIAVGGRRVAARDGTFTIAFDEAPRTALLLVATDAAGNRTEKKVKVRLVPRRPRAPVRSVHVTFHAWANPELRRGILRLVDEGRINSVELDLKDEAGIVGWNADIPFGKRIGAVQSIYDLEQAIDLLHARGVYVIGRLVAFRDPIHAQAAWRRGDRAQVVQAPGNQPYAGYGGFTNFANPVVRDYNIDVAERAAEAGIDDVLFDYIRRPDGPRSSMVFPGLKGTPEASIASFLEEARERLKPYRVFLGASVFGVAATRPTEVAQDIPAMARHVDYIAPMVYASHWAPGEYGVANPNAQPYDITYASVKDFVKEVDGTGARIVPWLQDFSLGVSYGPNEVRAQIKAARDAGAPEWILWDPLVTYTVDALDPGRRMPPIRTRRGPRAPAKPKQASKPQPADPAAEAARKVRANELGAVPVLMYHQIRADGGGDYDLTPAQFRAELERLYREGYRPIRAVDLATGNIEVPAGKSPVVLTFDDSTKEQLAWDAGRRPKPNTAMAIMLEFAKRHPDFKPAGTFYVNRAPFAGVPEGKQMLRWLHDNGFELGNHTHDHLPFGGMSPTEVQRQLVRGKELILEAVPEAKVATMALPLGVVPEPPILARKGSWRGRTYEHAGVFLVGAEPAPSPFSRSFKPGAIPRIRTSPPGARDPAYGSTFWLDELRKHPERRYVSDGDPKWISFPRALARELAPRLRSKANPY